VHSVLSRTISALSRNRDARANQRFSGSLEQSDQPLHIPITGEFRRQPIQQLGVRRQLASCAEVFGCANKSGSEEQLPDLVDCDASRQRMIGCSQPLRERQTICHRTIRQGRQARGNAWLDEFAKRIIAAVRENMCWLPLGGLLHDHRCRER
jgi:hypothetical protein